MVKKLFLALMVTVGLLGCDDRITEENGQNVVRLPCGRKFEVASQGARTPLNYVHRPMRAGEVPETHYLDSSGLGGISVTFIESRCPSRGVEPAPSVAVPDASVCHTQ